MALRFEIFHKDRSTQARVGRVTTPHGAFDTPAFMPVGTKAAVKGLLPAQVAALGSQIILANTYHLMLRPGSDLVARMGGLQRWMGWNRPILTDSGGFQVFSLAKLNRITDAGVTFKSHLDGATIELTPQRSIQVQNELGADIIMAFDDCPPCLERDPAEVGRASGYDQRVEQACDRTARWLEACIAAHARKDEQALFGIVQGGIDLAQRTRSVAQVCGHDLPGYAIGGVAVGEGFEELRRVVEHTAPLMPADRPRYLMGVGYERDILTAVRAGVDMFDCVLPTRNGRTAHAFTSTGTLRLRNACYAQDAQVIEPGCDCPACGEGEGPEAGPEAGPRAEGRGPSGGSTDTQRNALNPSLGPRPSALGPFSRSYLRHLFMAGEMLGPILVSAHNIRHFQRFVLDIRRAIADNDWSYLHRRWPVLEQTL